MFRGVQVILVVFVDLLSRRYFLVHRPIIPLHDKADTGKFFGSDTPANKLPGNEGSTGAEQHILCVLSATNRATMRFSVVTHQLQGMTMATVAIVFYLVVEDVVEQDVLINYAFSGDLVSNWTFFQTLHPNSSQMRPTLFFWCPS